MPKSTLRFQGRGGMNEFRRQVGEMLWNDTVETRSSAAESLHLSLNLLPLGTGIVAHDWQSASGLFHIERGRDRLARNHPFALALSIVRSGTTELMLGGGSVQVRAGNLYMMNANTTLFKKTMSDGYREHLVLVRSETLVPENRQYMREPLLVTSTRGAAALLAEHVHSLFIHGADVEPSALGSLSAVLLGLVDVTFSARSGHPAHQATVREAQRQRVMRFMRAQLRDPTLTPARIAAAHRISLRYLHKLFEGCDRSLCATLLEMRLQACKLALEAGGSRLSVGEIAYAHGFLSHAHFCRAFKARFGVSASELRNAPERIRSLA